MSLLFHHPLCPHSRFIRLALAEYGLDVDLFEEKVHERRQDFLLIDPAGRTPVLVADGGLVVPGAGPIAEWIDEAYGGMSINLADGYALAYFHTTLAPGLAAGQSVRQGQYLGTVAPPGQGAPA